jgi:hypothetical protein
MIHSALRGAAAGVARCRAIAMPAGSLPWMHPTISTVLVLLACPILIARIGRPLTERPIVRGA